ncbi:MAG: DUF5106 domain-containing protein [Bacteroidia bacterium]|nr:DUF5106 domain-containing protein [Bacteroidia bacterium]MCZ2277703.1 DUF5106 domain-containing protein [Bacteroidia bacterium]
MRTKLFILIVSFVILAPFASLAQKGFNIKVTVKGVAKDSICYLANYYGDKQYLLDSAKVGADGSVTFKADTLLPGGLYLFVLPGRNYFEMVVDKEQRFIMETDTADLVANMKVQGSKDNQVFYDYLRFIGSISKRAEAYRAEYDKAKEGSAEREAAEQKLRNLNTEVVENKTEFLKNNPDAFMSKVFLVTKEIEIPEAPKNPDGSTDSTFAYRYYKEHFFDNIDMKDERLIRTPVFHQKIEQYINKLTPQTPDSIIVSADRLVSLTRPNKEMFKYIVWWITNHYETSNIMGFDAVFVHMAEKYYTKDQAYWVDSTTLYKIQERVKILKPILIGKKLRNLVLKDTAGVYRSMYDIKKPYTLIYIWDPDCGHCKKATPRLKVLYDHAKKYGFEIYAIDNEAEHEKWLQFIREHNLNWINVADMDFRDNFRYEFDIHSTPQMFLLDAEKKIIAKKIDVETLSNILADKFNNPELKLEPEKKDGAEQH